MHSFVKKTDTRYGGSMNVLESGIIKKTWNGKQRLPVLVDRLLRPTEG